MVDIMYANITRISYVGFASTLKYIYHTSVILVLCYCSKVQTILQELHCINYIYSSIQMQEIKSCGGILHISFLHLQKKWASKKFLEKT